MTAGEKPDSPTIQRALEFLRQFGPDQLNSTYAVGLQTMVFAAAEPDRDRARILANVEWLERGQIKLGERMPWPGSWNYLIRMRNRRQLQHAIRPPGLECRQRGRRDRPARGLAAVAHLFRGVTRIATAAGATRRGTSNRPPA